jgi:Leucine-rich repeat (LRR) protein
MSTLTRLCVTLMLASLALVPAAAVTLAEYAQANPIKLFIPKKGAVMPNDIDAPGHLQLGTKALLLSGLGLSDLTGISQLIVEDEGKKVPVTSVQHLHLYVNRNGFTALPDEIGALDNVEFLYCEDNQLSTLPRALADMDRLIAMYFTGNRFTEIPAFVYDMNRLTKLQFSRNQLTSLPAAIGKMTGLRHFNIAGNQISELPDSIALLTKLRVCDFSDNRITALPEAFGTVQIVNQLRVRNNPLTSLPLGFATMRATIDITGTKIDPAKLPPELRAKISTEKPPGSKDPDSIVVTKPVKPGR